MKKIFSFIAITFLIALVLTGCSSYEKTAKADSGNETVNMPSKEGAYVISKDDHHVLVVDAKPQDFSADGGLKEFYNAISFSNVPKDLEIGQRVLIEVDGPVMESYPAQAKAKGVVILPTYKPDKADLTEAQVVQEAVKIAGTKSSWFPAIRYVDYDEVTDTWKVGIKQEENEYEVEIEDQ